MRISEFLVAWRSQEQLTIREAGKLLKVPFTTLHQIEGGRTPDIKTVMALMNYMFSDYPKRE